MKLFRAALLASALKNGGFYAKDTGLPLRTDGERAQARVPGWRLSREPFLLETNVPGLFCAGDVRHQSVKRVASAVGEGAIAVQFTHRYLAEA